MGPNNWYQSYNVPPRGASEQSYDPVLEVQGWRSHDLYGESEASQGQSYYYHGETSSWQDPLSKPTPSSPQMYGSYLEGPGRLCSIGHGTWSAAPPVDHGGTSSLQGVSLEQPLRPSTSVQSLHEQSSCSINGKFSQTKDSLDRMIERLEHMNRVVDRYLEECDRSRRGTEIPVAPMYQFTPSVPSSSLNSNHTPNPNFQPLGTNLVNPSLTAMKFSLQYQSSNPLVANPYQDSYASHLSPSPRTQKEYQCYFDPNSGQNLENNTGYSCHQPTTYPGLGSLPAQFTPDLHPQISTLSQPGNHNVQNGYASSWYPSVVTTIPQSPQATGYGYYNQQQQGCHGQPFVYGSEGSSGYATRQYTYWGGYNVQTSPYGTPATEAVGTGRLNHELFNSRLVHSRSTTVEWERENDSGEAISSEEDDDDQDAKAESEAGYGGTVANLDQDGFAVTYGTIVRAAPTQQEYTVQPLSTAPVNQNPGTSQWYATTPLVSTHSLPGSAQDEYTGKDQLTNCVKGVNVIDVDDPVIGGHVGIINFPLLSKMRPLVTFADEEAEELTVRIQNAGTYIVEAKSGSGSATLSMAYVASRFVESSLRALEGESETISSEQATATPFLDEAVMIWDPGIKEIPSLTLGQGQI